MYVKSGGGTLDDTIWEFIKFYYRINVFKFIEKKHGNGIYAVVRTFENIKARYEKTLLDIKSQKLCKIKHLIPIFANVRLAIKRANIKLKHYRARIIQRRFYLTEDMKNLYPFVQGSLE